MGRKPCCAKEGMNKGAWTAIEDKILTDFINENGEGKWRNIPKLAGLKRCGKSCRLRWLNYLRPDIKRGNISPDEEDLIVRLHKLLGNRWSLIAGRLPGRTDNEIKNYWNTNLSKKTQKRHLNKKRDEKKTTVESHPNVNFPKASKCKTIMATPQQDMPHDKKCDTNVAKVAPTLNPIMAKNMVMESESSQESSLLGFKTDSFSEFSMNLFDMEEICFSDIVGSDYTQNVMQNEGFDNNNPSLFSDQSIFISERMMGNWKGSDCARVNEESDFRALASFFESTEEWLGIDQYSI